MAEKRKAVLEIAGLRASYGPSEALHGISLDVAEGEVVTLLGRNGAGKTTTLRAIIGLMRNRSGSIRLHGVETIAMQPERIARLGVSYCPEERGIFSSLSVAENLTLPPVLMPGAMTTEEVYDLFPRLYERRSSQGTKLSGGEQQMLAIARILRTGARFLLLDEPTEGLAPVIVDHIGDIIDELRRRGYTILLVEQNFDFASHYADRFYVIENGHVETCLTAEEARLDPERVQALLSV